MAFGVAQKGIAAGHGYAPVLGHQTLSAATVDEPQMRRPAEDRPEPWPVPGPAGGDHDGLVIGQKVPVLMAVHVPEPVGKSGIRGGS